MRQIPRRFKFPACYASSRGADSDLSVCSPVRTMPGPRSRAATTAELWTQWHRPCVAALLPALAARIAPCFCAEDRAKHR